MRLIRLFTVLVGLGVVVVAQPCVACSDATLKGNYGFVLSGVNSAAALTATVGQITADGSGGLTGSETVSDYGVIASNVAITGSTLSSKNCAGTAGYNSGGRFSVELHSGRDRDANPDGRNGQRIPIRLCAGARKCQLLERRDQRHGWLPRRRLECLQLSYTDRFRGAGRVDGAGSVSGTQRGSFGGLIYSITLSGTYLVNANAPGRSVTRCQTAARVMAILY